MKDVMIEGAELMPIYNIEAGSFAISVEVESVDGKLPGEDITHLIMGIYQGAINLTEYYDKQRQADVANEQARREHEAAMAVLPKNKQTKFSPTTIQRPKGVALDCLLDHGGYQDIFLVAGKNFARFMKETMIYGIGFYTARNALQKGYYPGENAVVLVNEEDSPTTQRILDKIEHENPEELTSKPSLGSERKNLHEWMNRLREKKDS